MNALHVFTVDAHQHVWDAAQVDYPRLGADTDAMFAIAVLLTAGGGAQRPSVQRIDAYPVKTIVEHPPGRVHVRFAE